MRLRRGGGVGLQHPGLAAAGLSKGACEGALAATDVEQALHAAGSSASMSARSWRR